MWARAICASLIGSSMAAGSPVGVCAQARPAHSASGGSRKSGQAARFLGVDMGVIW